MSGTVVAPRLVMVVAVAENGVIGQDGGMPWRLPTDLRHFRALTMGKPLIMGRKTFESIGRPLDGRHTIVLSRDPDFAPNGVEVVRTLDEAVERGAAAAEAMGADEIAVVGGGAIYAALLDRADHLYVTQVHAILDGDTTFPPIDPETWERVRSTTPPRVERDSAAVTFAEYERRKIPPTG